MSSSAWVPNPSPALSPGPADRARYWLIDHWDEPDAYVAKLADCGTTTARRARQELEAEGVIDVIPASQRERRTLDGQRPDTSHAAELPPVPPELARSLCRSSPDLTCDWPAPTRTAAPNLRPALPAYLNPTGVLVRGAARASPRFPGRGSSLNGIGAGRSTAPEGR
jgi:hypothetical protein